MTQFSQLSDADFCAAIFDHVRSMSKDHEGVTRQGYGPLETQVLDYLEGIGRELNLEISKDAAGNVWMTLPGRDRTLPAVVSGSHADSVPQGGNYDGLAGIVAALTVARRMRREGVTPLRDYRVLMMRCEESSFFGKAYVGSLGMMGPSRNPTLRSSTARRAKRSANASPPAGSTRRRSQRESPSSTRAGSPPSSNSISSRDRLSRVRRMPARASLPASAATFVIRK